MSKKDKDEGNINIFKDIFGVGELSSSLSDAYVNTINKVNINKFPTGLRFFILIMFLSLIAIIGIPYLKIEAFEEFPFGAILIAWFCFAFILGGILAWIEIIKIGQKSKKR